MIAIVPFPPSTSALSSIFRKLISLIIAARLRTQSLFVKVISPERCKFSKRLEPLAMLPSVFSIHTRENSRFEARP